MNRRLIIWKQETTALIVSDSPPITVWKGIRLKEGMESLQENLIQHVRTFIPVRLMNPGLEEAVLSSAQQRGACFADWKDKMFAEESAHNFSI